MSRALYSGRIQSINQGRIDDLMTAFRLACDSNYQIDDALQVLLNGQHLKAKEVVKQFTFLGTLDSLIIGIGGSDPISVPAEQLLPKDQVAIERFFNPQKNPASYFQRMVQIKRLLLDRNLPAEKIDFLPVFPEHFYPTVTGFTIPFQELAFQYLGVEKDRDFGRVEKNKSKSLSSPFFYHDYRDTSLLAPRESRVDFNFKEIDNQVFNLYVKRFIVLEDGTFGKTVEHSLEKMFEDAAASNRDSVLAMVCFPRQGDRTAASTRWNKLYEEVMKLTPYQTYMKIKEYLIQQGFDLSRIHISPTPADFVLGVAPEQSRSESYLPKQFILYTEKRNDGGRVDVKNQRISIHPNYISVRYTD